MNTPLRILHLEDSPRDAELIHSTLEAESLGCDVTHVKNREEFEKALEQDRFHIILSDYGLPHYDGFAALGYARAKQPHVPFILLSGTLGEEQAVDSLKNGATDYVLKQRLTRLVPAIRRAVVEAEGRAKRQDAEERVREQATLLDKAQDAIFVRDLQDRIVYWNQSAERVYGWTAAEVMGRNVSDLFSDETLPQLIAARQQAIECGEWLGELRQTTKHGKAVIVESRWTFVRDDHGQPKSILVINTDVTEKRHIEAQFLRTQRMETIGALAGGIAHDLNNMLSPIMLGVDLLQESQTNEDNRETLDLVRTSAQRGADMVKQILSFARGVSGDHSQLDLKHVINDMTRLAKDTFPRSICIENSIGSG
ncbi:MAG TPA: PAS domain S-box protein, partial [Candidatus Limnocylindria bacterium]|nr:PAS domain S-box protein [Candidatus Limnocylindria bacterium]